ncbi:flagellar hook-associated protein FlgL [Halomonas nitroreducens]|uniref:Flagellar hook-filament junction protein FlgL n=1 Tax=Halomonas nitroreducens TaxID=447425 RepID=A0A3S0HT02_9GAMM|nr:flagellar hook-associated protein FlgL [Halomonas nitroreducens]RTR04392.1 flagellar hook-filament junction protein FlgL [Halomonas nitroreducens]
MRISTVTMFEQSVTSLNRQQGDFLKVSQQIASGRRVVNPSDDPQAASRAVGVDQAKAVTQQYADSRVSARNSLSQSESVLNSVSDAVTRAKTLLIQASNDTLSDADRQSVAFELRGVYETLLGQANATDGNGRYLFGGYKDDSEPFVKSPTDGKVEYRGDENIRRQHIDSARTMKVTENGKTIFQIQPGGDAEGLFTTLENSISVLETPAETDADKAELRDTLSTSMNELDDSLDNVLTVRASMGARLNELDVVDAVGGNRMLNYEQTLSDLVDLDYAEAISEYSLRQVGMQASQKAFADLKGMSLFQYL